MSKMSNSAGAVLSETYRDFKLTDDIKKKYRSYSPCKLENYELITTPFRLLKLNGLIKDDIYLKRLKKDLLDLPYIRKDNDLYNLQQSADLNSCTVECVTQFVHLLRSKIEPLLASIMGVTFNGTISITASLYKSGEYLLCHDDRCDDRCVAFVYYLTESTAEAGGHFRMFDHDAESGQPTMVSQSVPPMENSFICFEVGNFTYHEVGEVLKDNFERLSINGWFHSDKNLNTEGLNYTDPMPQLYKQLPWEGPFMMDDFINRTYCMPSNVILAQEQFEKDSFILLSDFFLSDFFKACADCLKNSNLSWYNVGPANRRKYDSAKLESLPDVFKKLINFLKSPMFVSYLKDITGLDLEVFSNKEGTSCTEMTLQVQKWSNGSYTMATDNDAFFHVNGLDMMVYFKSDDFCRGENNYGGCTTYLASSVSDNESSSSLEDTELLTVEPHDNALILIYRTSDTVRFSKYVNHFNSGSFYSVCATYFEP